MAEQNFLQQLLPEGFFQRVKLLVTDPKAELESIAVEEMSDLFLWKKYAAILAAIAPICSLIGMSLIGVRVMGVHFRISFFSALSNAVLSYLLALGSVFLLAWLINFLAPKFEATADANRALKLAVFAAVPGWLTGVFLLLPSLSILTLVGGVYGLYLLYLGMVPLMSAPQEKAGGYAGATIVIAIVIRILAGVLVGGMRMF